MPGKTTLNKPKPKASKDAEPMRAAKVAKPMKGNKPNALQQPLKPSAELVAAVGDGELARGEAVSKVWAYIKANKLQNTKDGREILADDTLRKVFGKDKVTMSEMNKHLAQHLK
jgi:chromatin remodeling complex protein RSC6